MFMVRHHTCRRLTNVLTGQWVHRRVHIGSIDVVGIHSTRLGQHNVYTVRRYGVVRTLNRRTQVAQQSRNGSKSGRYAFDTDALCHGSPGMCMSIHLV
jgi:hypothetical protein